MIKWTHSPSDSCQLPHSNISVHLAHSSMLDFVTTPRISLEILFRISSSYVSMHYTPSMKLLFTLTALLPLAASSPSNTHKSRNQNLQTTSHESSKRAPQIDAAANSVLDYLSSKVAPSSLSNIIPWSDNDDGLSEVLDYITTWLTCPRRYLNCEKCPYDRRCRRSTPTPTPSSDVSSNVRPSPTPIYFPRPRPYINPTPGEPESLTGPQLRPLPDVSQNGAGGGSSDAGCTLSKCGKMVNACGQGATCIGAYCACASGMKGSPGAGSMGRGWDVPESATVYVEVGVACDQQCNEMFCTEVGGLEGCFGGAVGKNEADTTNTLGHGAIQIPGAGGIDGNGPSSVVPVGM